ncbi:hypothetical protein [Legionella waltersii]|uniref:Multifunctional virulence effector protein DrrA n=1 Tax=Legionella waltersii TaxID=66969 RepID=A0A0W1ACG7_9GAMM|nr:hypothetical protein [Legionella waltersii]KTD78803.1 multifunctional virulence effector protein DrrA [Legionella waltersii]SNV11062.1 substrate of the Dot/Icm secretion system [Legionella waltersii]
MKGKLSTEEYLKRRGSESAEEQAKRIFDHLIQTLQQDPNKKIGLIYAANNTQAEQFYRAYQETKKPEKLPTISGSGQAAVFSHLNRLINQHNKKNPSFSGRIRVLPVATSLYGGENGPGNIVDASLIDRDLKSIQDHLLQGYDVQGIPNASGGFAIGGLTSKYWFTQRYCGVTLGNKSMSQGEFVQSQLDQLKADPHQRLAKTKLIKGLHYKFATTPNSPGRDHGEYTATSENYKGLQGDALKTKILSDFRDAIAGKSAKEIQNIYDDFKTKPEYTILATGQGWATRFFHWKTSSIIALNAIKEEAAAENPRPTEDNSP